MYFFFQYTPVVNYGTKVDNASFTHNNIGIDDSVWKNDSSRIDGGRWRNVSGWMNKRCKLSANLINPDYPLYPKGIIAKCRDERG